MTGTENAVLGTSLVMLVGGLAAFIPAFATRQDSVAVPALIAMFTSIPLGWWAQGAFEEVPVPGGRLSRCRGARDYGVAR